MANDRLPRYGVTGARGRLSRGQKSLIQGVMDTLPRLCVVVTGACIGVDAFAARYAAATGRKVHTIVPGKEDLVDPDWRRWCDTFKIMPPDSTYRDRNVQIVHEGEDGLLGFPRADERHRDSRRSGTWQTIRLGVAYRNAVVALTDRRYILMIQLLGPEPTE